MSSHPFPLTNDLAVPQRDHLMDLDAMARRLSIRIGRHGPVSIRSGGLECVSYRPGRRLRVAYRFDVDGRELHVAASTFRSNSRGERAFLKASQVSAESGPFRPVVYDPDIQTVFWAFPNDRRIENLSAVADAHEDVAAIVDEPWVTSRLVDYYPEASAVVSCLDGSGRVVAYAKVTAGHEGECTYRIQKGIERRTRSTSLRVARPLGYSRQYRTLVVEPMAGESIGSLTGSRLLTGLRAYGAALATLHCLPMVDGTRSVQDSLGRLQRNADGVRKVRPDVEQLLIELLEELAARWDESSDEPVLIHGDTNENNALLQRNRIALIDFDRAAIGPAASDLGNFLGLLRYFRHIGLISAGSERARAGAFLEGYSSVRSLPDRESLRLHESAALAERAFRAVTRLRDFALPHIPSLLNEASELLR